MAGSEINSRWLSQPWEARWISHPEAATHFGVYLFRRVFELDHQPQKFVVHVSADNRFELLANGVLVGRGPARGDLEHWRFETLDLAPYLKPGRNVLSAVVWNFAEQAPMAQITHRTAFLLQGDSASEAIVNTPGEWKCYHNKAYTPVPRELIVVPFYFVVGPGEQVDGTLYPWGWESGEYNDSAWVHPVVISRAYPRGVMGNSFWRLVPDGLPKMEDRPIRFQRIRWVKGTAQISQEFLSGSSPAVIPAGSKVSILLDQGHLTTAYPELVVSGGRGARILVRYAEALWQPVEGKPPNRWLKGNRDIVDGKVVLGLTDVFLPDGGSRRLFRPLWWRTYRYVEMEIETAQQPLKLEDIRGRFTGYPYELKAEFDSSEKKLEEIWQVSWRTLRLCSHETFMDCPYYEQLQYIGDTRIQALIAIYLSGDDRLVRNALEQFDQSRIPEGITRSRYPSRLPQYIPPFSLWWVNMIHDHWMLRGDAAFSRKFLRGIQQVINWFSDRLHPDGLLGPISWWPYVDWTPDWRGGTPPGGYEGGSCIITLQMAAALRAAAELEAEIGSSYQSMQYQRLRSSILQAVQDRCWSGQRQLIADTPAKSTFSQQANVLGILEDAIPQDLQKRVAEKLLSERDLTPVSYYFTHYLVAALRKAGLGERYFQTLQPWHKMLADGLTTWAESPFGNRSDCHAWSAHPAFWLLSHVAGIEPAEPGFRVVKIQPHLGKLSWIRARTPSPRGDISVELKREGEKISGNIKLPEDIKGELWIDGCGRKLVPGNNTISCPSSP